MSHTLQMPSTFREWVKLNFLPPEHDPDAPVAELSSFTPDFLVSVFDRYPDEIWAIVTRVEEDFIDIVETANASDLLQGLRDFKFVLVYTAVEWVLDEHDDLAEVAELEKISAEIARRRDLDHDLWP